MLKPERISANHEELFLQRYNLLRGWALRLTGNDQQQAEDLLHDAFIHFSIHHPSLDEIKNLEGYLHTMLRNLHLSQSRRAARSAHGHFLILDYDSAEIGLHAIDPREQIKVRDELCAICEYACRRKESSKAGSVLILRFFHGYYPDEIAKIMRCTRTAVEHRLRLARTEARLYLQNPGALAFMQNTQPRQLNFGNLQENILENLRRAILESACGECPTTKQLGDLYQSEESDSVNCATLAHIVGCQHCLERTNSLLGLPPLSERSATDSLGPDTRSKGGGGSAGGGGASSAAAFARQSRGRMKQVLKHTPREMHISVNGFILGSQKISSEVSELTLNVSLDEKIGFVEVFSESDVRLFFLNIEPPPDGPVEQPSHIELSDDRSLEVALNFSDTWPRLYVVYHDPLLSEAPITDQPAPAEQPTNEASREQIASTVPKSRITRLVSLVSRASRSLLKSKRWLSPATVTATFAVLLIALIVFVELRKPNLPVSAAEMLHRSSVAEEMLVAKADVVLHRTISLEERELSGDGGVLSRRRLELWDDGSRKIRALRVYDDQNRLINGEWTSSDGSQVLYDHSVKLRREPTRKSLAQSLAFDEVWRLTLSAAEFSTLIEHPENAQVEESASEYTITYQNHTAADGLQRAIVKLNRPELRAISQTLVIRHGTDLREYRFTETSFEQRPANAVAPAVFDPDPDLLSERMKDEGGKTKEKAETNSNSPASAIRPVATAELEVEVLRLLNQASALSGEQISMTRTPEGQLRVQGVVDSETRKREILSSLAPVLNNPAVSVEILTATEAVSRERSKSTSSQGPTSVEGISPARDTIPVDAEVRKYFAGQGTPPERIDEEIRQFSRKVLNRSRRIRLHALALKQIVERFSTTDLQTLDPATRAKWRTMIVEHAHAFQQESAALRRELEPIFPAASVSNGTEREFQITQDGELAPAVSHLYELASSCDENVGLSFSIAAASQSASPVRTPQFWRALKSAEQLAARIAQAP